MTSNFTQKSVSKSCERIYTEPIAAIEDFTSVVDAFIADNSMGITNKEKKSETYKVPVKFFDTYGKQKGQVYLTVQSAAVYKSTMAMLAADTDLCTAIAGDGSDATEDKTETLWTARVSGDLNGDTFTAIISREKTVISGYSDDATIAVLETWFDANENTA